MSMSFKLFWTLVPQPGRDWEMLTESILIPDEWIPMAYARLSEFTAQEIPVSGFPS